MHVLLARAGVPTPDLLPRLFGLQGEDVDDAVLFEAWLELWLACAAGVAALAWARRTVTKRRTERAAAPVSEAPVSDAPDPPWNAATIVLWLSGWAALSGAVLDGHWTAAFLARAAHVPGTIASADRHPRIRFTDLTGATVEFTQNGSVSRPVGADVPVAYGARDPSGTARADTFWANWSDVLGLLWIGMGSTLFPFFGYRATLRAGRW